MKQALNIGSPSLSHPGPQLRNGSHPEVTVAQRSYRKPWRVPRARVPTQLSRASTNERILCHTWVIGNIISPSLTFWAGVCDSVTCPLSCQQLSLSWSFLCYYSVNTSRWGMNHAVHDNLASRGPHVCLLFIPCHFSTFPFMKRWSSKNSFHIRNN